LEVFELAYYCLQRVQFNYNTALHFFWCNRNFQTHYFRTIQIWLAGSFLFIRYLFPVTRALKVVIKIIDRYTITDTQSD